MTLLLLTAVAFLAYSNGANDNFKGVASLFGSRTSGYRVAISWATITTFAGSVAAIFLAQALLKKFSGKGLVPDTLIASPQFVLAVAFGAGATVILATLLGFPISTTHGLTGALVGAGLVAAGSGVNLAVLGKAFVMPLLLSPLLAVATGGVLYRGFRFARGLNDTPKIAALLLVASAMDIRLGLVAVAAAMAVGGLLNARRVADTMSHKITGMNPGQGFAANLSTALLVTTASLHGLPVSTTHVSVGSLLGMGVVTGQTKWNPVLGVLASWVMTLPCAAVLAAAAYAILRHALGL